MKIKAKIRSIVFRKVSSGMIDIVEVRTKEIGLASVTTETDVRIKNTFFLPITIVAIKTDLLNRDGVKVGRMIYSNPQQIKGKSDVVITTVSEINTITSIFQAISTLLQQSISMRSVGSAYVQFLWWIFEVPVDDAFEIHPSKLKIVRDETDEEREQRLVREAERKERREAFKENRKAEKEKIRERILKERYGENYIPKEERNKKQEPEFIITNEEPKENETVMNDETENLEIRLDETAIQHMAEEGIEQKQEDSDEEKKEEL